jgi:hypothetical protein
VWLLVGEYVINLFLLILLIQKQINGLERLGKA